MTFGEAMARLKVACETERLPRDLGRWLLERLEADTPVAARLEERDRLLRAAVEGLSGSRWSKARRLVAEIKAINSGFRTRSAQPDEVRSKVEQAVAAAPAPRSVAQLLRVLAG